MSDCPSRGTLQQLLDEQLSADERPGVETHVQSCTGCQELLTQLTPLGLHLPPPGGQSTVACGPEPAQRESDPETGGQRPDRAASVTLQHFVDNLNRSGLLSAAEVSSLLGSLPAEKRPSDAQGLARELIRQGKLTKFQAAAVYQGKIKSLVLREYVILERLGAGGMGEVFQARHRGMNRVVALKVLPPRAMSSPDAVRRFQREAKAAARLLHPNIVTAFDADEDHGLHFLVMEYVEGQDLARIVKDHGPLGMAEALDCILQAAKGLEYAHTHGVVHRDIKPANLLLSTEGTVKVLDMGLARLMEVVAPTGATASEQLTGTEQVMGTYDYMAPEQAEHTHTADHRADIYALGCTLYRLLTGKSAYPRDSLVQSLLAHREAPIPALRIERRDVPKQLDVVFQKMLAKRPEDRQQSMREVIADLESCRQAVPLRAGAVGAEPSSGSSLTSFLNHLAASREAGRRETPTVANRTPTSRPHGGGDTAARKATVVSTRRNRLVWSGAAAVAICFTIILAFVLRPGDRGRPNSDLQVTKPSPPLAVAPFDAKQAKRHQQVWADHLGIQVEQTNSIGMKLILIPPGEFDMGSSAGDVEKYIKLSRQKQFPDWVSEQIASEAPNHYVRITRPFHLGVYEVTNSQFGVFVDETHYKTDAENGAGGSGRKDRTGKIEEEPQYTWKNLGAISQGADFPVANVSSDDATAFCEWLSRRDGNIYHLPTEAEWEYACRAGIQTSQREAADETTLAKVGWFGVNSDFDCHLVGEKMPNPWGVFDIHGNVAEWCSDFYASDYYANSPINDPKGPADGQKRVARGG